MAVDQQCSLPLVLNVNTSNTSNSTNTTKCMSNLVPFDELKQCELMYKE